MSEHGALCTILLNHVVVVRAERLLRLVLSPHGLHGVGVGQPKHRLGPRQELGEGAKRPVVRRGELDVGHDGRGGAARPHRALRALA